MSFFWSTERERARARRVYISALIRSEVEMDEGRIFTFGVTKSPSLALPDGECEEGGTTAAVG